MGIAIKPMGALISVTTRCFCADAVLDHDIKETIVVIICPSGSLVGREIVLQLQALCRGHIGEGPVAVIVE